MRFFDNAPTSWYEEMKSWFPRWYADIAEMDALWHTWGVLLDRLQVDIQHVLDNYFIASCDEDTIAFWEKFIGIHMESTLTLEQRRRFLITLFSGFGKCSKSKIQQLFRKLTGTDADVEFSVIDEQLNQALSVWVDIQNSANWNPGGGTPPSTDACTIPWSRPRPRTPTTSRTGSPAAKGWRISSSI